MAMGLAVIRFAVGAVFIGHGAQKLFGWFGGSGVEGTSGFMESLGFRPGRLAAVGAGLAEAGGGFLLLLGLLTPFGSLAVMLVMIGAIASVHWPRLWNTEGGMEYPLVLLAIAWALAFTGPGRYSLDRTVGLDLAGVGTGVAVAGAAIVLGIVLVAVRAAVVRRPVARASEPPGRSEAA